MNQLDKSIQEKLANRTFTPSSSAWERLAIQLDDKPKRKKKGWLFFAGIAASIAILFTIGVQSFGKSEVLIQPKEIIVENVIDTISIQKNIDNVFNDLKIEGAVVSSEEIKDNVNPRITIPKSKTVKEKLSIKRTQEKPQLKAVTLVFKDKNQLEKQNTIVSNDTIQPKKRLQKNKNNTIKINSEDLLYAVTHSSIEVKVYYAKYQINREDVLKTIKSELNKSNIQIQPETILAEVERTINDEDFQNNFMKSLKKRVTNIASALASRND